MAGIYYTEVGYTVTEADGRTWSSATSADHGNEADAQTWGTKKARELSAPVGKLVTVNYVKTHAVTATEELQAVAQNPCFCALHSPSGAPVFCGSCAAQVELHNRRNAETVRMVADTFTAKRAAIAAVRAEADALIEQAERRAKGYDRGLWRDDMRPVDCNASNTIRANTAFAVAVAFELSARFAK